MALGITSIEIVNKGTHPLLVKHDDWERVELSNIADVQNGYAFSSELFNHKDGLPLIRIRDIFSEKTENYYSGEYNEDFVVNHKDILIGMDGDFKISRWPGQKGLLNQRVCRIKFFSSHYLESFMFICVQPYLDAIHSETSAVTVKHLSSRSINDIPFPLPPLPIQRAIVSKIEALFSDLDNGIANFKKAQEQLKIYRQAVLKKAFEGGFTNNIEVDGKLPNEWNWERIGDIVKTIDGDRGKNYPKKNEFFETEYCLFLSTKNVRQGYFLFEENIFITKEKDEILRGGKVQLNDVVITTRGTLGNVALFNEKIKYKHMRINSGMLLLRIKDNNSVQPEYLMKFITSTLFFNQLKSLQTGTAQPQIPANILREIKIAYPKNLAEQTQIVAEIERRLSVCDKMEQSINESIEKAEALRQSILKKAFEGRLLSEAEIEQCKREADYEPASELLKKIKADASARSARGKLGTPRQARGTKVTTKKKSEK